MNRTQLKGPGRVKVDGAGVLGVTATPLSSPDDLVAGNVVPNIYSIVYYRGTFNAM